MNYKSFFKNKKITLMGLGVLGRGELGNPRFSDGLRPAFLHGKTNVFPTPFFAAPR